MAQVEIVKKGRKLGEINDEEQRIEISKEWADQPKVEEKEKDADGNGC